MTSGENTPPRPVALHDMADFAVKYRPALRRYFQRCGADNTLMDDLVQEVFVRLAKRAENAGTREIESAVGYLMQTASSVWHDHIRQGMRRHHNTHVAFNEDLHTLEDFAPDRVYEGKEAIRRLADALEALPPRTCEVYVLCRIDGMKQKDVARRLGLSVSAVEKHLMRATAHITSLFGEGE